MSTDYFVRLAPDRVPRTQEWNDAIRKAGFELSLDPSCEIRDHSGFWPCVYQEDESGFELYAELIDPEVDAKIRELEGLEPETDGRNFQATFSAGSENEIASARVAAAILAELTDGQVSDTWSGEDIAADQARAWAKSGGSNPGGSNRAKKAQEERAKKAEEERAKFLAKRLAKRGRI